MGVAGVAHVQYRINLQEVLKGEALTVHWALAFVPLASLPPLASTHT